MAATTFLYRKAVWRAWFGDAILFHLELAARHFENLGFGPAAMRESIAGPAREGQDEAKRAAQIRRLWQRTGMQILLRQPNVSAANFWRRRLERWQMGVFPRVRVIRAQSILSRLQDAAPPCVRAALLRSWFNGWCTGRRFQQPRSCIFGCSYEDSIEHYAWCPVVREFAWRRLAIPHSLSGIAEFLLLDRDHRATPRDALIRLAIRTAAVYRVHCRSRHAEHATIPTAESLGMAALELVRGHPAAAAMVRAHVPQAT